MSGSIPDPVDMVGVEEANAGLFAVTLWSLDGEDTVILRSHNTNESANEHCLEIRAVLATWMEEIR